MYSYEVLHCIISHHHLPLLNYLYPLLSLGIIVKSNEEYYLRQLQMQFSLKLHICVTCPSFQIIKLIQI